MICFLTFLAVDTFWGSSSRFSTYLLYIGIHGKSDEHLILVLLELSDTVLSESAFLIFALSSAELSFSNCTGNDGKKWVTDWDAFLLFVLATTEDAELAVTSAFILSRSETKAPFVFVEVVAMATACSVPLTLRAVSAEDWAWKHKRETRIKDLKIRL